MNTEDSEFKRLEHEALLRASQPEHHPQHSHSLQERLAELHLYEEINEHYAKCNAGAENLRDWVAERMDTESIQPVPLAAHQASYHPALYRNYPTDVLDALHDAFMALPPCPLFGVIGNALQEIESLRQAQPVQPPQRPWVGLTEKERLAIMRRPSGTERGLAVLIEAKLKEKNE